MFAKIKKVFNMFIIDIILLLLIALFAFKGFKNGLIIEVASLAALILGIYGAIKFSDIVSTYLARLTDWNPKYLLIISFGITFIIIVIIVHLIARLINKFAKAIALGFVMRISGLAFGIIKIIFIISVLINLLDKFDNQSKLIPGKMKEASYLYLPVKKVAPSIFPEIM
ncbi:MAG: CvpA family protein [Bacteroidia bacterium]|nr:CvpA family protein [Bacteroidia bacterium]